MYELIKNAKVNVQSTYDESNNILCKIQVNDKYEYTFDKDSRISKALKQVNPDILETKLSGGSYFFIDKNLVDYRDNSYNGYIHDDQSISKLMDHIGFSNVTMRARREMKLNTPNSKVSLFNIRDCDGFKLAGYNLGGEFTSSIGFLWSPFYEYVSGLFRITRVICDNGMVGTRDLVNAKVPLINRWEEHLDIATSQLQQLVQVRVNNRLQKMALERANVKDLMLINDHANKRLDDVVNTYREEVRVRLSNIAYISSPEIHLSDYYEPQVFDNTSLAARLPGHLSKFDAWNLVTEMCSHTYSTEDSSVTALQKLANMLVFPARDQEKGTELYEPILSKFSDTERAFFGITA